MFKAINIDHTHWDWTSIDTEEWLKSTLGKELDFDCNGDWLAQQENRLLEAIEGWNPGTSYARTDVDNTYNHENDFNQQFQFQIFYPEDCCDYLYADDVYVAVEVHQGGDVRGNYGRVRLYRADSLADAGFFDWTVGWRASYADGTDADDEGRFGIGYCSHPTSELSRHLARELHWSDKRNAFVGFLSGGRAVEVTPYVHVY